MRISRTLIGLVGGLAVATATVALQPADATAKSRRKGRTRGALRVIDINVEAQANVPQNRVIEIRFNKRSVNPAQFQIRSQNATGTGFAKQIPGEFQVFGNVVRFFPRLPTHRRDPNPRRRVLRRGQRA